MSLVQPEVVMNETDTAEAVTTPAQEEVTTAVPAQEVATTTEAEVVRTNNTELRKASTSQFLEEQEQAGFEGLDIGAFSFERIRLHEGKFLMGSEDSEVGKEFNFIALSTRALYIVRQDESQDAEMYYSYCPKGSTNSDGTSAQETLDKWLADGFGEKGNPLDIRRYLEVMAELVDRDDEYSGTMVSLSIPPSSVQRFSGMAFQAARMHRRSLDQVVISASVGAKAGEGSKAFRPWNFKLIRTVNA